MRGRLRHREHGTAAFIELMRSRGYRFASLVHPFSNISRRARITPGCIVNAGAVIGSNAMLSEYTIVNRGALIGHDDRIGTCCTVGPGANIAGNVEIGEGVFIAQGAVIREPLQTRTLPSPLPAPSC
jgi:UDP-3-O-[3-hydroxymyristoyl] glucosamine N-acyltransferase